MLQLGLLTQDLMEDAIVAWSAYAKNAGGTYEQRSSSEQGDLRDPHENHFPSHFFISQRDRLAMSIEAHIHLFPLQGKSFVQALQQTLGSKDKEADLVVYHVVGEASEDVFAVIEYKKNIKKMLKDAKAWSAMLTKCALARHCILVGINLEKNLKSWDGWDGSNFMEHEIRDLVELGFTRPQYAKQALEKDMLIAWATSFSCLP